MKFCSYCGAQIPDTAAFCTQCGASTQPGGLHPQPEEPVNKGLIFLAVLAPLFGLIYGAMNVQKKPERARVCKKASMIGLGVWVAIVFCLLVISLMLNHSSGTEVGDRLRLCMTVCGKMV